MPAGYDSPTQTGNFDDCDDAEWDNYYPGDSDDSDERHDPYRGGGADSDGYYGQGPGSRPYTPNDPRLYSPSRGFSRSSSTLSFSVLGDNDRSRSPQPFFEFEPLTQSRDLESPTAPSQPLPALHEWYGQPLHDILTLPEENANSTSQTPQSVDAVPAVQPVPSSEARQPALELSQFFDNEAARLFNELLHQPREPASTDEDQSEEPEERFIVREEDIDLSAIRDRSVMDVQFAREMPVLEPEVPLASAPQAGYTAPEEFEPPYYHPLYNPPANDGQMSHAVEALPYLCTALDLDENQLTWTLQHRPLECFQHLIGMTVFCHATSRLSSITHMTALTPESHVSVTGTKYSDYLRNQCNFTVTEERKHYPLVELADRFLAPLESLVLYYHI